MTTSSPRTDQPDAGHEPERSPSEVALPIARAVAVAGAAFLLLPTLGFGLGFDHGFFHLLVRMAAKGLWPYADVWDTAFPGILLVHAPTLLWGGSSLSLRLLDYLVQLGTAVLMFETSRRLAGPLAGMMGSLLYAGTYTAVGYYGTAQRDGFVVPLLLGALLVLSRDPLGRASSRRLAAAGALFGLIGLFRPTYGLLVLVIGLALIWDSWRHSRSATQTAARLLWFWVPAAIPIVAFLAVYAFAGRLWAVQDVVLFLSTVYPELERRSPIHVLYALFSYPPQMLWLGVVLALVPTLRPASARLEGWVWSLLLLAVGMRLLESKTYAYQYWPAWSLAAILSGAGWGALIRDLLVRLRAPVVARRAVLAAVVLGVIFPILSLRALGVAFRDLPGALVRAGDERYAGEALLADVPEQAAVGRYLRDHVPEGQRIQLWGLYPMVYFLADRPPASRFILMTPFVCVDRDQRVGLASTCTPPASFELQRRFLREYLEALRRDPPLYIVTTDSPTSLEVVDGVHGAPDFPELRAVLSSDYQLETRVKGWAIYRLRQAS